MKKENGSKFVEIPWPQERPPWCVHQDCLFTRRVMDYICGGFLPKPEPHLDGVNHYRLCLRQFDPHDDFPNDPVVYAFQVNANDVDWLRWVFDALDGKKTSSISERTP